GRRGHAYDTHQDDDDQLAHGVPVRAGGGRACIGGGSWGQGLSGGHRGHGVPPSGLSKETRRVTGGSLGQFGRLSNTAGPRNTRVQRFPKIDGVINVPSTLITPSIFGCSQLLPLSSRKLLN